MDATVEVMVDHRLTSFCTSGDSSRRLVDGSSCAACCQEGGGGWAWSCFCSGVVGVAVVSLISFVL